MGDRARSRLRLGLGLPAGPTAGTSRQPVAEHDRRALRGERHRTSTELQLRFGVASETFLLGGLVMRVLHVEDDLLVQRALRRVLVGGGLQVEAVSSKSAALSALEHEPFDSCLVDIRLGELGNERSGLDIVHVGTTRGRKSVVFTATNAPDDVAGALRSGAVACLPKSCAPERVLETLRTTATRNRTDAEAALSAILGKSERMASVRTRISKFGPLNDVVLVTGEPGTGKELVARALHACSERGGKFVALNVASMAPTLFEGALFGHEKGAFTGADKPSKGAFAEAEGGTLFLDEFGELTLAQQAVLLRVFQEHVFTPLGGQERTTTARLIVATNRNLEAEVARGTFRLDLLSRVSALPIAVPPLRERIEDLAQIASDFALRGRGVMLSDAALAWLKTQSFPANVRTLQHLIIPAAALATEAAVLEPRHFIDALSAPGAPPSSVDGFGRLDNELGRVARRMIDEALTATGGNQTAAAKELGISRQRLASYITRLIKPGS